MHIAPLSDHFLHGAELLYVLIDLDCPFRRQDSLQIYQLTAVGLLLPSIAISFLHFIINAIANFLLLDNAIARLILIAI